MMLILGVGGNEFQEKRSTEAKPWRLSTVCSGCMPSQHLEEGCQSALWVMMVTRLLKRGSRYVLDCALFISCPQPDILTMEVLCPFITFCFPSRWGSKECFQKTYNFPSCRVSFFRVKGLMRREETCLTCLDMTRV